MSSIQYAYPSMDKIYWIESPCKLSHKKFQDSLVIVNEFSTPNLLVKLSLSQLQPLQD